MRGDERGICILWSKLGIAGVVQYETYGYGVMKSKCRVHFSATNVNWP